MNSILDWRYEEPKYGVMHGGFIKKWRVFSYHYDSCCSKVEVKRYKLTCFLPGLKSNIGHFETEQEAKDKAEFLMLYWIDKAGLGE